MVVVVAAAAVIEGVWGEKERERKRLRKGVERETECVRGVGGGEGGGTERLRERESKETEREMEREREGGRERETLRRYRQVVRARTCLRVSVLVSVCAQTHRHVLLLVHRFVCEQANVYAKVRKCVSSLSLSILSLSSLSSLSFLYPPPPLSL